MEMYNPEDNPSSTFEQLVKDAPRLERVHEAPSPDVQSLASLTARDRDGTALCTPTRSPTVLPREQPRRRSVSLKTDALDVVGSSGRVEDGSESTATTSLQATPQTQSLASSPGRATAQDYVEVVVRLKPTASRVPDADIRYKITDTSGSRSGSARHAQLNPRSKERPPGATPRTSRTRVKDMPGQVLEVWPPGPGSAASHVASGTSLGDASSCSSTVSPRTAAESAETAARAYRFRHVLPPSVSDDDMCAMLIPEVLEQLRNQYSVCILCYGQTGSGKTHTINALTPALTKSLFSDFVNPDTDIVELSYIQIYNDRPYNLLTTAGSIVSPSGSPPTRALRVVGQHGGQPLGIPLLRPYGLEVCEPKQIVADAAQALRLIRHAQALRSTTSHTLNARSSRAHTLLTLHVTRYADGEQPSTIKVTLTDLAGSERLKRSGATGETKDEAIAINRSLSALQSLVQAKSDKSAVLPVRETVLNRYLASRLRDWHLMFIVTTSVEKDNYAETKSSLEFAATSKACQVTKRKARPIGPHSPRPSEGQSPTMQEIDGKRMHELESEIEMLRTLLSSHARDLPANVQELARQVALAESGLSPDEAQGLSGGVPHLSMDDCAALLSDRVEELRQLSERDKSDQEQSDALRDCVRERLESLRSVWQQQRPSTAAALTSPRTATVASTEAEVALRSLENYFLQAMELTDAALERCRVEERGRAVWLAERRREEAKYAALSATHSARCQAHEASIAQCAELEALVEGLRLQVLQEKLERAVGEEASQILNDTVAKETVELLDYRRQLEELRQAEQERIVRIPMLEGELTAAQRKLEQLRRELSDRDETFQLLWSLATPQQKTRFHHGRGLAGADADTDAAGRRVASPPPASEAGAHGAVSDVSLAQGHEVIQLRAQVTTLRAELADREKALRMSENNARLLEQQSTQLRGELKDASGQCYALRQDEERQAVKLMELEQEATTFAQTLAGLRDELMRTREAFQARGKEIERLEEVQHTAQALVTNLPRSEVAREERATVSRVRATRELDRVGSHESPSFAATATAATPTPTAMTTATTTTLNVTAPVGVGSRRYLTAPTPSATAATTAPPVSATVPVISPASASTRHGDLSASLPASSPLTGAHASAPVREGPAPALAVRDSAGPAVVAPARGVAKTVRQTRPAARPRLAKSGARTVPFEQTMPPQAFTAPRRRSTSTASGSEPAAGSARARARGASLLQEGRRLTTHTTASSTSADGRQSHSDRPGAVKRRPQAAPDTVVLRRPHSGPASTISQRPKRLSGNP